MAFFGNIELGGDWGSVACVVEAERNADGVGSSMMVDRSLEQLPENYYLPRVPQTVFSTINTSGISTVQEPPRLDEKEIDVDQSPFESMHSSLPKADVIASISETTPNDAALKGKSKFPDEISRLVKGFKRQTIEVSDTIKHVFKHSKKTTDSTSEKTSSVEITLQPRQQQ
ncbi:hypothetical protein PanWU01x14_043830 [Parasponia andersonii]|uniref:Uncharacterized protein n=1 Tax=Parasponia andersonii TaxID=3476 RepID=A0A2P5DP12_PARAD|nr:hypothetical protein PanWU01x14_043830 [Parasponia andersonii]